jgi:hypothetical protein
MSATVIILPLGHAGHRLEKALGDHTITVKLEVRDAGRLVRIALRRGQTPEETAAAFILQGIALLESGTS